MTFHTVTKLSPLAVTWSRRMNYAVDTGISAAATSTVATSPAATVVVIIVVVVFVIVVAVGVEV